MLSSGSQAETKVRCPLPGADAEDTFPIGRPPSATTRSSVYSTLAVLNAK